MAILGAKELESIIEEARQRYAERRLMVIEALEKDGMPFGSVRLSPAEQVQRYRNMGPREWAQFIFRLENRYRGLPDHQRRVQDDIDAFVRRMDALSARVGGPAGPMSTQPETGILDAGV